MVTSEDIDYLEEYLNSLSSDYKLFYASLRKLKGEDVSSTLLQKSEDYTRNGEGRLERIKAAYNEFLGNFRRVCDSYVNNVNSIEEEERNEVEQLLKSGVGRLERIKLAFDGLSNEFDKLRQYYVKNVNSIEEEERDECGLLKVDINILTDILKKKAKVMETKTIETRREPSFVYNDQSISKLNVELVLQHPGSYYYREYVSDKRTSEGNVFIDIDGSNDELIVKYMKNDKSLIDDMKKMNIEKRSKLIDVMSFLELPIKGDIIKQIGYNEDNEIMEAWRERRVVMVNGKNDNTFNSLLKRYKLFDSLFNNEYLKNIHYYKPNNIFYINVKLKYCDVIEDYLKNGKKINKEIVKRYDNNNADELMNEMTMIGIKLNERERKEIRGCFYQPLFVNLSKIIDNNEYDKCLQIWVGDYKWKMIYRASEHGYTAESFHKYCDDQGPTLIVIKSSRGWIFGGYTTKSWSGWGIYDMI